MKKDGIHRTLTFEALLYVKNPNNGKQYVVRIDLGNPQTQGGTNTSGWDDVISDKATHFLKPGTMSIFAASFDASAMQSYSISDFKVATTGELEWLLENALKNTGAKDLRVTTFGRRVEMNMKVYNLLKENPRVRLFVDGDFTLSAGLPEDAINLLFFHKPNITTDLHIESKQVANTWNWTAENSNTAMSSTVLGNCTIDVARGGELDTKTNNIEIAANVTNAGTVTAGLITGNVINNAGTLTADNVTGTITNAASATIVVNTLAGGAIVNNGIATIASATATIVNNDKMTLTGAAYDETVINASAGTMTISGASQFKKQGGHQGSTILALDNRGILNINAAVSVSGANRCFGNSGTATIAENISVTFSRIYNSATLTIGEGATLTGSDNAVDRILNTGTINNNGTLHSVNNRGLIVTGANSSTAVTNGTGTIDNSAMGDVSYNDAQICRFVVEDVTGIAIADLNNNVIKADANKLIIKKGILKADANFDFKGGSITCENRGYFGKGVEFGAVTVNVPMGVRIALYTDGFKVTGDKTYIEHGELAILKTATEGTTATITGRLDISNFGTFRGGSQASLILTFADGAVHNSGTVKFLTNTGDCQQKDNNHWTGNAAE